MIGGKIIGEGAYGQMLDTYSENIVDKMTLHSILSTDSPSNYSSYFIHTVNGKRLQLSERDAMSLVAIIGRKSSSQFITKRTFQGEAFLVELAIMQKVMSKLSARDMRRLTTLNFLPFMKHKVIGIETPTVGVFALSRFCNTPMDRYYFEGDADVSAFIVDILEGFSAIHRAGIYHCDVKLDNMIFCSVDKRYKLIDWGKSCDAKELVLRYVTVDPLPNNTASPVAWLAWGLSYSASIVHMTYSCIKHLKNIIICPRLSRFILHSSDSYTTFLYKSVSIPKTSSFNNHISSGFKISSKRFRKRLVEAYGGTFDLFDFGFILASLACTFSDKISEDLKDAIFDMGRRLTSYGDPDFIGNADDALQQWKATPHKKGVRTQNKKYVGS